MTDFDDRMAALRARFVERARADRRALDLAIDVNDHQSMRRIAHGLAGNAGIFGFSEITEAARAVEEALDAQAPEAVLRRLWRELDERLAAFA